MNVISVELASRRPKFFLLHQSFGTDRIEIIANAAMMLTEVKEEGEQENEGKCYSVLCVVAEIPILEGKTRQD